ncbi:hypothetical protein PtB15_6B231 [Puccinia triticina]|nr:hypothetical protein PtB15_6B231 [Puccinia triticina]
MKQREAKRPPESYLRATTTATMHCLFYVACFLAVLQSALAVPTLAPRADTTAIDNLLQA